MVQPRAAGMRTLSGWEGGGAASLEEVTLGKVFQESVRFIWTGRRGVDRICSDLSTETAEFFAF